MRAKKRERRFRFDAIITGLNNPPTFPPIYREDLNVGRDYQVDKLLPVVNELAAKHPYEPVHGLVVATTKADGLNFYSKEVYRYTLYPTIVIERKERE